MAQGSIRAGRAYRLWLITAPFSSLILLFAATTVAATSVYRCTSPAGEIEFRQTPCAGGAEERKVWVRDRKAGWKPARTEIERKPERIPRAAVRKHKPGKRNRPVPTRQEEKCWHRHQLLEEINRKLRRGYRPATGEKLRRKRQIHEDYIQRFCK